jgi:hypothetical protein
LEKEGSEIASKKTKLKEEIVLLEGQEKTDAEDINMYQQQLTNKITTATAELEKQRAIKAQFKDSNDEEGLNKAKDAQEAINAQLRLREKSEKDLSRSKIEFDPNVQQREMDFNLRSLELAKMEAGLNEENKASHDEIIAKKKEVLAAQIALNQAEMVSIEQNRAPVNTPLYIEQEKDLQKTRIKIAELTGDAGKLKTEWQVAGQQIGTALANDVGTVFTDILEGSKSVGQAFGDMAKAIIADILKIIAKMLIMKAIQSTLGQTEFGAFLGLDKLSIAGGGGNFMGGRVGAGFKRFAQGGRVKDNLLGKFNSQEGIISGPGMKMLGKKFDAINRGDNLFPSNKNSSKSGGGKGQSPFMPQAPIQNVFSINAVDAPSFARMLATKDSQAMIASAISAKVGHNSPIRKQLKKGR